MRAVRNSPLLRIVLLSLAVLFAHSMRANAQQIVSVSPACAGKVAAAQPDPEKKLPLRAPQILKRGHLPGSHNLFGGSVDFTGAHGAALLFLPDSSHTMVAHSAASIAPQRRPFDLRI